MNAGASTAVRSMPCYAPQVGDCFSKPGTTLRNSLTGLTRAVPEQHATVTMTDGHHVVCVINGLEYTLAMEDFMRLAEKTLANGATLRRAGHNGRDQRPGDQNA